jgi:hypothetical protein
MHRIGIGTGIGTGLRIAVASLLLLAGLVGAGLGVAAQPATPAAGGDPVGAWLVRETLPPPGVEPPLAFVLSFFGTAMRSPPPSRTAARCRASWVRDIDGAVTFTLVGPGRGGHRHRPRHGRPLPGHDRGRRRRLRWRLHRRDAGRRSGEPRVYLQRSARRRADRSAGTRSGRPPGRREGAGGGDARAVAGPPAEAPSPLVRPLPPRGTGETLRPAPCSPLSPPQGEGGGA